MAQPKPEKVTLDQVLRLVEQLSPSDQSELVHRIKYNELRRDIQIGIEQSKRGEVFSEEEALSQLHEHEERLRKERKK